jgi:hypothetical protein
MEMKVRLAVLRDSEAIWAGSVNPAGAAALGEKFFWLAPRGGNDRIVQGIELIRKSTGAYP